MNEARSAYFNRIALPQLAAKKQKKMKDKDRVANAVDGSVGSAPLSTAQTPNALANQRDRDANNLKCRAYTRTLTTPVLAPENPEIDDKGVTFVVNSVTKQVHEDIFYYATDPLLSS